MPVQMNAWERLTKEPAKVTGCGRGRDWGLAPGAGGLQGTHSQVKALAQVGKAPHWQCLEHNALVSDVQRVPCTRLANLAPQPELGPKGT